MDDFFKEGSVSDRGFCSRGFTDCYGVECSISESSLATENAIWIGPKEIGLKQFIPNQVPSWRDVSYCDLLAKFPNAQSLQSNTAMHLTQDQVKQLIPVLLHFSETGQLPQNEGDK